MEWKEVRLGDIVEIVNGFAFKSKAFTLEGIPVIKIKNIKAGKVILNDLDYISTSDINPKYTKIRSSDILITMTGNRMDGSPETWVGKVSLFRHQGDFYLNQRVSALRLIDDSVDNNFLSYYLSSWQSQLYFALNSNSSGGQANITPAVVQEYRLMVPGLEKQRSIASILSSLDRKIELNNKINADLEEMAQAIFKNWFVDFEPFKDGKFVDSELGMIPEGWRVGRLDEIADVVGGSTPSKAKPEHYTQKGIAWLTPKDLSNHPAVYSSRGEIDITEEGYNSTSTKLMPKGTVLFTSRAPIGYISIAQNDICTNQGFKSLVPKKAGTCFLYCFLKYVTPEIENKSTGSTFKEASGSLMKSLQVIIPEQKDFEKFEAIVSPLFARIESLEKENSRLSLLRDTLLPRLMSGELKIPE